LQYHALGIRITEGHIVKTQPALGLRQTAGTVIRLARFIQKVNTLSAAARPRCMAWEMPVIRFTGANSSIMAVRKDMKSPA
jgi:hypothetical protein